MLRAITRNVPMRAPAMARIPITTGTTIRAMSAPEVPVASMVACLGKGKGKRDDDCFCLIFVLVKMNLDALD